jgi:hypothetical protein
MLTQELATEIDEHAQSEQALRRLEEKVETVQIDLKKKAKENKALKDELAISEETAKAANADTGTQNAKIQELEDTV